MVHGLLIAVASLDAEHRLWGTWASVAAACGLSSFGSQALEHKLNSCSVQAWLLHGMWDPPGPEIEPVSPALAGGSFTTEPPGKPLPLLFKIFSYLGSYSKISIVLG